MNVYLWIALAAWIVFIAVWFFAAFFTKRTINRQPLGTVIRIAFAAFVVALVNGHAWRAAWLGRALDPVANAAGAVLVVLGVSFAIYARYYLGRNWGMPMSERADPELVSTGPYAYVRHPIYTGVLLAAFGSGFVIGYVWFLIALAFAAYFIPSALVEERKLAARFPSAYPAYKARTKMLIPYVL